MGTFFGKTGGFSRKKGPGILFGCRVPLFFRSFSAHLAGFLLPLKMLRSMKKAAVASTASAKRVA